MDEYKALKGKSIKVVDLIWERLHIDIVRYTTNTVCRYLVR